ncbi:MAG: polyhydroxyalkanoic acid system family protein [Pirellulales bacterium]|nr:polyhydroxyalkanoic acid system family protein [Pirellulales bacterium]
MPQIRVETPHVLGREAALQRLQEKFDEVYAQFGNRIDDLQQQWADHTLTFSFRVTGMSVRGTLAVEESTVDVHADLPLPALFFKSAIEQRIREELTKILA